MSVARQYVHLAKSKSLWVLTFFAVLLSHQVSAGEPLVTIQKKRLSQLRPSTKLVFKIYRHDRDENDAREIHVDLMVKDRSEYPEHEGVRVKSLGTLTLGGPLPESTVVDAGELQTALFDLNRPTKKYAFYLQARTEASKRTGLGWFHSRTHCLG